MATATKYNFYINNYGPYRASKIKQGFESQFTDDSNKTDDGVMHIDYKDVPFIRNWAIELPVCTATEVYNIFSKIKGQNYTLTVFDLTSNSSVTVHAFTENSSADCYSGVVNEDGLYQGVAFTATETGEDYA